MPRRGTGSFLMKRSGGAGSTTWRIWLRLAFSGSRSATAAPTAAIVLRAGRAPYGDAGVHCRQRACDRANPPSAVRGSDAARCRRLSRAARRRPAPMIAGYPVVHRLGTRHVHRRARAVPDERTARRCAATCCSHGPDAVSEGMLPNRFPDAGEAPEYNSVDASLWYVVAVGELLATGTIAAAPDRRRLLDCGRRDRRTATRRGTRFGIRADRGRSACRGRARHAAHLDGRARSATG